jgi:hypothetical protein
MKSIIKRTPLSFPKIKIGFRTLSFLFAAMAFANAANSQETVKYTTANSSLASDKVTKIYIDSFDVKWFGTDKGISRFDGKNWTIIDKSNYLKNNTINDIAYEKTKSGDEIWVATNGGLSVMSYNVDGVTAATTYHVGGPGSGIINDTVTAVGVDANNNKWIATPTGLNTLGKNGWDTTYTYMNEERVIKNWDRLVVNSIGSYKNSASAYIGTSGEGVLRFNYDEVDGFTGASALGKTWSHLGDGNVNSVTINDSIQWYGTTMGAFEHFGPSTKEYWDYRVTELDGIVSPMVYDIEKDNNGDVWIGTDKGINIVPQTTLFVYQSSNQANLLWSDGYKFSTIAYSSKINDMQKDAAGNIWIASDSGVEKFIVESKKRIVFAIKGNEGSVSPVNGTTYNANSEFGKGSAIGNWFCVYNGAVSNFSITGLEAQSAYRIISFDYTGSAGSEKYTAIEEETNPTNFTTTKTSKKEFNSSDTKVYPIPFDDYLVFRFTKMNKDYRATLYTLDGKICKSISLVTNNQKMDTSDLKKGVYLMKISDGEKDEIIRIIK